MEKDDVIETFNLLMDKNVKKVFDADISARIPYRLHCCVYNFDREVRVEDDILYNYDLGGNCQTLKILNEYGECLMYYQIRPYLRPMTDMTEEEKKYITDKCGFTTMGPIGGDFAVVMPVIATEWLIDFYNSHHIDWRGFIERGLALEAPEGMYEK